MKASTNNRRHGGALVALLLCVAFAFQAALVPLQLAWNVHCYTSAAGEHVHSHTDCEHVHEPVKCEHDHEPNEEGHQPHPASDHLDDHLEPALPEVSAPVAVALVERGLAFVPVTVLTERLAEEAESDPRAPPPRARTAPRAPPAVS